MRIDRSAGRAGWAAMAVGGVLSFGSAADHVRAAVGADRPPRDKKVAALTETATFALG